MNLRELTVGFAVLAAVALALPAAAAPPPIHVLTLTGPIEPAVADYIGEGTATAERAGAGAVLIRLDTPGGSLLSMQKIVQAELNSKVPIIVYVSPRGAWAASAGTFITMAANIAAMAPGTNIGAAHPVSLVPTPSGEGQEKPPKAEDAVTQKEVNYAAEYLASIAEQRGRNTQWARKAVRESASLKASDAVKTKVVDFIANDVDDLLAKADGRKVETAAGPVVLRTRGAALEERPMAWYKMVLHFLGNPLVTYLLMLAAIYGIIFEINSPGAILPGVVGGIAVILLLYSLSVVPVNYAGLLLILLAIGLFIADIKVPTHGVLTVGGAIAFFLGSFMVFGPGAAGVPVATLAAGTVATALFFIFLVGMGAAALRRPVVTGRQGMIGQVVTAATDIDPTGRVFAEGTWWTAESESGAIKKGEKVRIVGMEGLTLRVERAEE